MSAAAAKRTVLAVASIALLIAVSVAGAAGGASKHDNEPPTAPEDVHVTSATESLVHLAWTAAEDNVGVAGYYVYQGDERVSVDGTSHVVSNLACGVSTDVAVSAFDAADNESTKVTTTISTAACADTMGPSTPSGFRQIATTQNAVVLAWTASTDDNGVVTYGVYRDLAVVASPAEPTATLSGLTCGSTYAYSVDAADAAGNRSALGAAYVTTSSCDPGPTPVAVPTPAPPSSCPAGQFRGEFYGNKTLSGSALKVTCEARIDNSWGQGGPGSPVPTDAFSARWTGKLDFPAGDTTFTATADDGIRLWVDGTIVIDIWKNQAATTYTGRRTLTAGAHDVKVEYYENIGPAVLSLGWTSSAPPSSTPAPPSSCPAGQFRGEFYGNKTLSGSALKVTCEARIDNSWGQGGPGSPVPTDAFSARWTGKLDFPAGDTTFTATADDGIRLWVDGTIVIDIWKNQAATTYTGRRTLTAGAHDVKVEYYENIGPAVLSLGWTSSAPPSSTPAPPSSCPAGQFRGEFYGNKTLSGSALKVTCEARIDNSWGQGGPGSPVPTDAFSARWTGKLDFPAGDTTFTATADDGIRLWVDGTIVIDIWKNQAATTYTGRRTLTAGAHDVKVEYYENIGPAVLSLGWTSSSTTLPVPDTVPPSKPSDMSIASASKASVALAWSPSTDNRGVMGYGAYANSAQVAAIPQPGATVSSLSCGTAYLFEADAVDAAGNRSPKAAVIGSTSACADAEAPTTPTNLLVASRTATSIALGWSASTDNIGVSGYGLYRAGALVGTSSTPNAIFAGLTCNLNHTLAVDAYDGAGNRSSRTTLMVSTTACPDTTPPLVPTGLAVTSVTQTGLTLTWNPTTDNVAVAGYDVFRNGTKMAAVTTASSSQTGLACGTTFTFGVVARDDAGNASTPSSIQASTAACSAPPAPTPSTSWSSPITITQGGTYSGSWESTSSTIPAIRVTTSQPVTITGRVRNLAGGTLIDIASSAQANVTIDHVLGYGGNGRFVYAEAFKSVTIRNCTIDKTAGIDLRWPVASSSVSVTRNRMRNVQQPSESSLRQFLQLNRVTAATVDISWNEIINTFGQSRVEDNISVYQSSYAKIHDNYIQGAYPSSASASFNGSGIMLGDGGGNYNQAYDNQIVGTTNVGIGIAGGHDNVVMNNRVVSDSRLDDGTTLSAANVGIFVWNWSNDPSWGNNHVTGNAVGWIRGGSRNDFWFAHAPNETAQNTSLPNPIGSSTESAEYDRWLSKLANSSVQVGA